MKVIGFSYFHIINDSNMVGLLHNINGATQPYLLFLVICSSLVACKRQGMMREQTACR
jgi:hypothetical protein